MLLLGGESKAIISANFIVTRVKYVHTAFYLGQLESSEIPCLRVEGNYTFIYNMQWI